jgi:hypothetical protein
VGEKNVNSSIKLRAKCFSISATNGPTHSKEPSKFFMNPIAIELAEAAALVSSGAGIGNADMVSKASALEKNLLLN